MNTLILPGYSINNKEWAEKTKIQISPYFPTIIHMWKHWQTDTKEENWIQTEVTSILNLIGNDKLNIIAKSIGTLVTTFVLKSFPEKVNKLILCGIPLKDINKKDLQNYAYLKKIPYGNILCIQNENDPHASYEEVKNFLSTTVDYRINIVSKPRNDHEYPYPEEFINFLK